MFHRPPLRAVLFTLALAAALGAELAAAPQAGAPAAAVYVADGPGWAPVPVPQEVVPQVRPLPPLREQAREQQAWLARRVTEVLPALMREAGVDMWILSMREYAEDPVFRSLASPTTFAARRRSIYVFHDQGPAKGVVRLALGGGDQGGLFTVHRGPETVGRELVGDGQWHLLRALVEQANPKAIAVNIDPHHAFSDGLGAGEREALEAALGPELGRRLVRKPELALRYIELRLPEMMPRYRAMQETVHALLATAFSRAVIEPGTTTTEDVEWWLRDRLQQLGYTTWFQPNVERAGPGTNRGDAGWGAGTIERGDALWVDFGLTAMGLNTDTQHLGYVLRDGEAAPPAGLQECLATGNRLQDLLLAEMQPGRTGNEALAAARAAMTREGIDGTIYTHPVGDHGHGAGPLIGLWDRQEGVPVRGDVRLRPGTWFSIELQATRRIPEWNNLRLPCRLEEEAYLDARGDRHWLFRRQERFHLVR